MNLTDKQIHDLNNMNVSAQKAQLGDILSTGGQADWNQNDENAPDYVKNRPFYGTNLTIEWDGNTDGVAAISTGTTLASLFLVSNETPAAQDLIGGTVSVNNNAQINTITIPSDWVSVFEDITTVGEFTVVIAYKDNAKFGNFTFPVAGTYFMKYDNVRITCLGITQRKKIDENYLPDYLVKVNSDYTVDDIKKLVDANKLPYLQLGIDYRYARLYLSGTETNKNNSKVWFYFSSFPYCRPFEGDHIDDKNAAIYSMSCSSEIGWSDVITNYTTQSNSSSKEIFIFSSTSGSSKKFKITVDDSGTISATEHVE